MTCGSCGTEIADRAIVCYRCGAPTAAPAPRAPAGSRARSAGAALLAAAAILVAVGFSAGDDTAWRWAVWAGPVAAIAGAALLIRRRR